MAKMRKLNNPSVVVDVPEYLVKDYLSTKEWELNKPKEDKKGQKKTKREE